MFRSDLQKSSVTLVLLVATAFVSVAAVAAEGSDTIKLVKVAADPPTLGGAADDWFQRHPDSVIPSESATDKLAPLDWYFAHDHAVLDGDNNVLLGQSAGLATPLKATLDPARLASLNGGRSAGLAMPSQATLDPARLAGLNGARSAGPATMDNSSYQWIGPETVRTALSQLDDSNGRWIGPETVSAVLGQLQP